MAADISKLMADFEAKLTKAGTGIPWTAPKAKKMVEVETLLPPAPSPVEPAPVPAPIPVTACLKQEFKKLVYALSSEYVGKESSIKELVVAMVESLPQCED